MQEVKLTGAHKTYEGWDRDLNQYLVPGDTVDEEMANYFLEVLPPAFFNHELTQIGEARDHNGPNGAARYATLQMYGKRWVYTGTQPRKQKVSLTA